MDNLTSKIASFLFAPFIIFTMLQAWIENQEDESAESQALKDTLPHTVCVEDTSKPRPELEDKPVFVHGRAHSRMLLGDTIFNIPNENRISMHRKVEHFQWVQFQHKRDLTERERERHPYERERVEYTYQKQWCTQQVDSSAFRRAGHENPRKPALVVPSAGMVSPSVTVGTFALNEQQIAKLGPLLHYKLENYTIPDVLAGRAATDGRYLYITTEGHTPDPSAPQVGDIRVSWDYVADNPEVGILAGYSKGRLVPYQTQGRQLDILHQGSFGNLGEFLRQDKKQDKYDNILRLLIMAIVLMCCFRWLMVWFQERETEFWVRTRISGLWMLGLFLALETTLFLQALVWVQVDAGYGATLLCACTAVAMAYRRYRAYKVQREEYESDTTLDFDPEDYR